MYDKINDINYFKLLIYSLINIINPIFDILICYYYSPFHQYVYDIISNSISLLIEHEFLIKNLIIVIINIYIFFVCFIRNYNFINLDKNTKKKFQKEEKSIE